MAAVRGTDCGNQTSDPNGEWGWRLGTKMQAELVVKGRQHWKVGWREPGRGFSSPGCKSKVKIGHYRVFYKGQIDSEGGAGLGWIIWVSNALAWGEERHESMQGRNLGELNSNDECRAWRIHPWGRVSCLLGIGISSSKTEWRREYWAACRWSNGSVAVRMPQCASKHGMVSGPQVRRVLVDLVRCSQHSSLNWLAEASHIIEPGKMMGWSELCWCREDWEGGRLLADAGWSRLAEIRTEGNEGSSRAQVNSWW